jgi:hypothetical protein
VVVSLDDPRIDLDSMENVCRDLSIEWRRGGTAANTVEIDGVELWGLSGLDCDDDDPTLGVAWPADFFRDDDLDGFGGEPVDTCLPPGTGVATAGGDCDDVDAAANPDGAARAVPRSDGTFDWNCDGQITRTTTSMPTGCLLVGGLGCQGLQPTNVNTACGASGTLNACSFNLTSCTLTSSSFTQTCR